MNEQSRPRSAEADALASGERSKADIAAGRVEDFNVVLTELRAYYEDKVKSHPGHRPASQE